MTTPRTIESNEIIAIYVSFIEKGQGKRRPILVIRTYRDFIYFYSLTSQYTNKSPEIKANYYTMLNWKEVGLKKQTYIDTGTIRETRLKNLKTITKIGMLSMHDELGLALFLKKRKQQ
ncbi:MAG TPA: toxin-antitoxin system, toxin component, MazF family protein [Lactobacillus sp.]|nr:toxin-antitoxin system, toxin component, MazF family protein [Lactobacillus sp.]